MASRGVYMCGVGLRKLALPSLTGVCWGNSKFANVRQFGVKSRTWSWRSARGTLKIGLLSAGLGALAGGGYMYYVAKQSRQQIINTDLTASPVLESFPEVRISRQVAGVAESPGLRLTLFQYPTCPFCCKVRAFLDYFGLPYDVVEVDPVLRREIGWSRYKKVPILVAQLGSGYQQLNDSSMIISALASLLGDPRQTLEDVVKCYPRMEFKDEDGTHRSEIMNRYFLMFQDAPTGRSAESLLRERKWRKWADDRLVHVLSPNVYQTPAEALQAFNWFSEVGDWDKNFPSWERNLIVYVGAYAMWLIGKRLKKRHNLKENVRLSLYDECNHWARAVKRQGTAFLGGDRPDLGDLAVYGVLSSIEGCAAFRDALAHSAVGPWYARMKDSVSSHAGSSAVAAR
ncbi:prostaglandin E synthase 2 isoform X2 [Bacillus rossius redtenbacheri]|uniref:prostaglandin E synthase 2 isoform X2 n=1 Tax=Bacillus rossius redtenbacheri TaxID=93214 RepID=UPI002FDD9E66